MAIGSRPLRIIGIDAPFALIEAYGFRPIGMFADDAPTPIADALMGSKGLGRRGRSLLEQLLASTDPVLVTRADCEQLQVFAIVRELARIGEADPAPVHLLDLRHFDRASSQTYNEARIAEFADWLVSLGGERPDAGAVADAEARRAETAVRLRELRPGLTGVAAFDLSRAGATRDASAFDRLLDQAVASPPPPGAPRVYVAGTSPATPSPLATIETARAHIVGEAWPTVFDAAELRAPLADTQPDIVAVRVAAGVQSSGATHVVHLSIDGDEAAPWDIAAIRRALPSGVAFAAFDTRRDFGARVARFLRGESEPSEAARPAAAKAPSPARSADNTRSRKTLSSIAGFSKYQRDWFASLRARVAAGEPFAVVNANAPQEILRAFDIPFVVNQWWASIVAAKQQSRRYLGLLKAHDYPGNVESYSAQALAAVFDEDAENAPWGGLPRPDFVHAVASTDATPKIFASMAVASGAAPFLYERSVDPRWEIATDWWADLPDGWDSAIEPVRIDLLVAEIEQVIAAIEAATGRRFDRDRFIEVMTLVNEQEDYYHRTRDLIARAHKAPIGIVDSMPATMVPQWHRGTLWARDAAKAFHDEVAEKVAIGAAVCPDEQVRLMWVGRGLWSDMGFVQRWEESHGAVFVWSMYLALAADGYIRRFDRGRDPIRALAARFLTMGDELRLPSWGAPWHVHEAVTHRVDGAVALADADPFTVRALERAGIPVLPIDIDNFAGGDGENAAAQIAAFIEGAAGAKATERRARER